MLMSLFQCVPTAAPRVCSLTVIPLEFTLWYCDITKGHQTLLMPRRGYRRKHWASVSCNFVSRKLKLFFLLLFSQQAVSKGLNMLKCFYFSLIASQLQNWDETMRGIMVEVW